MASRYVEALRLERPRGPYLLGGWSMGGIVAFEMARQLAAAGARGAARIPDRFSRSRPSDASRVRSTTMRAWSTSLPTWHAPRAANNWASLEQLRGLDFEAIRNGSLARAIEGSEIAREIGAERLQRLHDVYRANRAGARRL